jgi:hypothetical protein
MQYVLHIRNAKWWLLTDDELQTYGESKISNILVLPISTFDITADSSNPSKIKRSLILTSYHGPTSIRVVVTQPNSKAYQNGLMNSFWDQGMVRIRNRYVFHQLLSMIGHSLM